MTAQTPKYAPLVPDIFSTFTPTSTTGPPGRPVSAFASTALSCRASIITQLASVIFSIPAVVLLIVGDAKRGWSHRMHNNTHLVGFPCTFLLLSLLADALTAALLCADNFFAIEWRDPTWREYVGPVFAVARFVGSWQFHAYEALLIALGAILVLAEKWSNGEMIAGLVLSFIEVAVHSIYLVAPLHRCRFVFEIKAEGGEFMKMVPVERAAAMSPIYKDVEESTPSEERGLEAVEAA